MIAFDVFKDLGSLTGASLTAAFTCSGNNRLLVVAVEGSLGADVITGVTYGGVALTKIESSQQFSYPSRVQSLWFLKNPASGSNNVVISASSSDYIAAIATSYTGVKQSGGVDNSGVYLSESTTGVSITFSTNEDNCWTVMLEQNNVGAATVGAGTTKRGNQANDLAMELFDSNGPITPAGSTSLSVSFSSRKALGIMASFAPAVEAKKDKMFLMF